MFAAFPGEQLGFDFFQQAQIQRFVPPALNFGGLLAHRKRSLVVAGPERCFEPTGRLPPASSHLPFPQSLHNAWYRKLEPVTAVSERRACKALDQPRSSQRYQPQPRSDEPALVKRMLEVVRERPRFGYRRVGRLLAAEGWRVGLGRMFRLWRREGLKVPQKRRKRRRLGTSDNACHCRRAEHHDDVWCWDFVFDRTTTGSQLKWLSIVDEHTRECLALKVSRSITSEDVIDTLAELFAMRGVPRHIRSDNGPEFIAAAIRRWLDQVGVEALYIEPGSPWENGYAESFHSRLRDEFLAMEVFENLPAARGADGGLARGLQPRSTAQLVGLHDAGRLRCRVCCFRSGCACAPAAHAKREGITSSPVPTFITPGTENQSRSLFL